MLAYTVELKSQIEGGYAITVLALHGCIFKGDTVKKHWKILKMLLKDILKY